MGPQEYVPGKCNVGTHGRAIRLATGLAVLFLTSGFSLTFLSTSGLRLGRLALALPFYIALLSMLEGSMSFCVFQASRGTYDFHERFGPMGKSKTRMKVESEEWRRKDRRKALLMHAEAVIGAVLLAALLFLV